MRRLIGTKQKKLKLLLLSGVLISFGIILAVFIKHRQQTDESVPTISTVQGDANVAIGKVHQTATKDGATEWSLDAVSVTYFDAQKKALFKDLFVTFFLKDGTHVYMTADEGILKTDSNDIEVTGNVVVKNIDYKLRTEILHYNHKERIIFSKVPVKIIGAAFMLDADSMSIDLNRHKAIFKGNIKGNIHDKVML
jgi:LPS export ABC transporter protein LptC